MAALLLGLACLLLSPLAHGAENAKKSFDIPDGDALATLKQFSAQGEARLLYSVDAVRNVKTNAVKGAFTPRDALQQLVANTGLVVTENAKDGALALSRGSTPDPNVPRAARTTSSDRPLIPHLRQSNTDQKP